MTSNLNQYPKYKSGSAELILKADSEDKQNYLIEKLNKLDRYLNLDKKGAIVTEIIINEGIEEIVLTPTKKGKLSYRLPQKIPENEIFRMSGGKDPHDSYGSDGTR